jgi:tRNA pseudouridine38-40 synthase
LGASKTDAGVHANDQKVKLSLNFNIENLATFQIGLNKILPGEIHLEKIKKVSAAFQVRQVKQKTYEYVINTGKFNWKTQRFEIFYQDHFFDQKELNRLFQLFVGEHEFFLFSGLSQAERAKFITKRTIDQIVVYQQKKKIKIVFQASGFLRYQIRMIIGSVLTCYLNPQRLNEAQIKEKLLGIGLKPNFLAPPNGLVLKTIRY